MTEGERLAMSATRATNLTTIYATQRQSRCTRRQIQKQIQIHPPNTSIYYNLLLYSCIFRQTCLTNKNFYRHQANVGNEVLRLGFTSILSNEGLRVLCMFSSGPEVRTSGVFESEPGATGEQNLK